MVDLLKPVTPVEVAEILVATSYNETLRRLIFQFDTLVDEIREIATVVAHDYPNIDNCSSIEKLRAIYQTYLGTDLANGDLHALIKRIKEKYNIPTTELERLFGEVFNERTSRQT